MARNKRQKKIPLTPAQKKEQRRIRRELRKDAPTTTRAAAIEKTEHEEAQFWAGTRDRLAAMKILNGHRERPWWLSIPFKGSNPPMSGFFPCSMFKREDRWYYGFLFKEHRDAMFRKFPTARKEVTQ